MNGKEESSQLTSVKQGDSDLFKGGDLPGRSSNFIVTAELEQVLKGCTWRIRITYSIGRGEDIGVLRR